MRHSDPDLSLIRRLQIKERRLQCQRLSNKHTIHIRCKSCALVEGISLCVPCFLRGSHTGHRWEIIHGVEGICDCGDSSALRQGCRKHVMLAGDAFWNTMFANYSDAEMLTLWWVIRRYNTSNALFDYILNSNSQMFADLLVFSKYSLQSAMISRDFNTMIALMLQGNLRQMLKDVLDDYRLRQLIPYSLLIKTCFFQAMSSNFDLLENSSSDFFDSLEIAQLLTYIPALKYIEPPRGHLFSKFLDLFTKAIASKTRIEEYNLLFNTRFADIPEVLQFVYDNPEFLQAFCRFHTACSDYYVTPSLQYQNYDSYLSDFNDMLGLHATSLNQYYKMADMLEFDQKSLEQLVQLLSTLYNAQYGCQSHKNTIAEFQLLPNYMLQLYIVTIANMRGLTIKHITNAFITCHQHISEAGFHMRNISDFWLPLSFIYSIRWKIWPRNHEDNQIICNTASLLYEFYLQYDTMRRYCVGALIDMEADIVQFLQQLGPRLNKNADLVLIMQILILCVFDTKPQFSAPELFILYILALQEQYSVKVRDISKIFSQWGNEDFDVILGKLCTQVYDARQFAVWQLNNFEALNIFQLLDCQAQAIVNYSVLRGNTELLPCLANFRALANNSNIMKIKAHTDVRGLLFQILESPDSNYDLYTYISAAVLNNLILDGDREISNIIRTRISDDHISLLLDGYLVPITKKVAINPKQKMQSLLQRLGERHRTQTLLISISAPQQPAPLKEGQDLCIACHEALDLTETVCIYAVFPADLNIVPYRFLVTCRHKFHVKCLQNIKQCPVCQQAAMMYFYHATGRPGDELLMQNDDALMHILQHYRIDFQKYYRTQCEVIRFYTRIRLDAEYRPLIWSFLKDQLYIIRQLVMQRIIVNEDPGISQIMGETFDHAEYFERQYALAERNKVLIDVTCDFPADSRAIIVILTTNKCKFCQQTLGTHQASGMCMRCGCKFHYNCLGFDVCCQGKTFGTYIFNFIKMKIHNRLSAFMFNAPYRQFNGDIPESLYGECFTFSRPMLDFVICQIVTGEVFVHPNENDVFPEHDEEEQQDVNSDYEYEYSDEQHSASDY